MGEASYLGAMIKTLIVEDTSVHLDQLLEALKHQEHIYEICATASSVESAVRLIADHQPELLFLDVEIEGGTAFDVLRALDVVPTQIIFVTAREEFALEAFRWAALDYLLKPIDAEILSETLSRLPQQPDIKASQLDMLHSLLAQNVPERIALHTQEEILLVSVSDITRCEADGNYCKIFIEGQKPVLIARPLKEYDQLLSKHGFLRVHQSHLVQQRLVRSFVKTDGGYLVMDDGVKIPVSTRRRTMVIDALTR